MMPTSAFLQSLGITRPTAILDAVQARQNIRHMAQKAAQANIRFRPHFKTHQSAEIGQWFQTEGVTTITVSSFSMAHYFVEHGWQDITVAFPVNVREMDAINRLASQIQLGVLVESLATIDALQRGIQHPVQVWLEIDTGYHRTGLVWDDGDRILSLVRHLDSVEHLEFTGILTHTGQTYYARSRAEIQYLYQETTGRMQSIQDRLQQAGFSCQISIGDTPSCAVAGSFAGIDEIRPGNFVFYDQMMYQIGACRPDQLALAVACPVVGVYPERGQIVVYGGAVHLSKEALVETSGRAVFGYLQEIENGRLGRIAYDAPVISLSQEHGIIDVPPAMGRKVTVGDIVLISPVHSCLTANLYPFYLTLTGENISRIR